MASTASMGDLAPILWSGGCDRSTSPTENFSNNLVLTHLDTKPIQAIVASIHVLEGVKL